MNEKVPKKLEEIRIKRLKDIYVDADYEKKSNDFLQGLRTQSFDYLNGAQDALNITFCEITKRYELDDDFIEKIYGMLSSTYMYQSQWFTDLWRLENERLTARED